MKYLDLHTDALTKVEGVFQVTRENLLRGGCFFQCFAAFVEDPRDAFAEASALAEKFDAMCKAEGYHPVRRRADIRGGAVNAMLTVEGGGAIAGSLEKLEALYRRGVRMMTLTWNFPNAIGWPNWIGTRGGSLGHGGRKIRQTAHGLTPFGHAVVEKMGELGMLVDVSHGSDRLFFDVAARSRETHIPFVASHAGADAVFAHARNLTDAELRALADAGGAVGLDFCAAFLSDDRSAAGQREALLAHARHIVDVGGEDVLAVGSDFDGIPENAYMKSAAEMPCFLEDLGEIFPPRVVEKIAYANALRVIGEVL